MNKHGWKRTKAEIAVLHLFGQVFLLLLQLSLAVAQIPSFLLSLLKLATQESDLLVRIGKVAGCFLQNLVGCIQLFLVFEEDPTAHTRAFTHLGSKVVMNVIETLPKE